jgi:LAO/AO transport system kinase
MALAQRMDGARPAQRARRVGLTGAPGAGKSTLIGQLAQLRMRRAQRLGVLAVDPSSPRTGGAILGDRVRMDELAGNERLYIRSLGSRRTGDGLADNLPEMLDLMDEFEFDEVILETVGVGQAEHAVRTQVDTLALVLLPDSGDTVQAMKAGIMEMADIFVVHKCDLPGAQRMATDLRRIAALQKYPAHAWVPPILLTTSTRGDTLAALSETIDRHQAWRAEHAPDAELARARYRLGRLIERRVGQFVRDQDAAFFDQPLPAQMAAALRAAGAQREP